MVLFHGNAVAPRKKKAVTQGRLKEIKRASEEKEGAGLLKGRFALEENVKSRRDQNCLKTGREMADAPKGEKGTSSSGKRSFRKRVEKRSYGTGGGRRVRF